MSRHVNGREPLGNAYGGEWIPATPEYRYDPLANRDPILNRSVHVCDPRKGIAFYYDGKQKEMVLLCRCVLPSVANFNGWLAEARKAGEVSRIVLFVCQELYRESYAWFRFHEFTRCEARERGEWFVLTGPAQQLKSGGV